MSENILDKIANSKKYSRSEAEDLKSDVEVWDRARGHPPGADGDVG